MDEPTPQCLREEECDAVSKKRHKVQCPAKEVWYAIAPTRREVLRTRKDKEENKQVFSNCTDHSGTGAKSLPPYSIC